MTDEKSKPSLALDYSSEAKDAAKAVIRCLASRRLTFVQATEALSIAKERLGGAIFTLG